MADYNIQKTTTSGLSVGMKTACDRIMLLTAKPELVHAQGATQKNIPANSGKIAQWRRWIPLEALITPLSEGVIPDGQGIAEEEVLATVYQYGGYVTKSDLFDMTHMDSKNKGLVEQVSLQGAKTIDQIVRNKMAETTTTQHANGKTSIYTLATTDKLTVDEIRKMVRTLKKNLTPMFKKGGNPYYLAIVGPDAQYDIQDDEKWLDVATYQNATAVYEGELGKLYGVRFLQTTECMKYENAELIADSLTLTVASITGAVVTVDEAIVTAEATALANRYVNIHDVSNTGAAVYERQKIVSATTGAAGAATVTLDAAPSSFTGADGDVMYANEYGYTGNTVYCTFVFGKDAYAMADIGGSGSMRTIFKSKAEIGGPLEQYATIGWKVEAMATAVLQPLWLGKILHGASE